MTREACMSQCQRVRRLLLAFMFNAPPSFSGNFSGGVRMVHCIIHKLPGPGYGRDHGGETVSTFNLTRASPAGSSSGRQPLSRQRPSQSLMDKVSGRNPSPWPVKQSELNRKAPHVSARLRASHHRAAAAGEIDGLPMDGPSANSRYVRAVKKSGSASVSQPFRVYHSICFSDTERFD